MLNFAAMKHSLREALLLCFYLKKSVVERLCMLQTLTKFEDEVLGELLDLRPILCTLLNRQKQEELAKTFEVTQEAISKQLRETRFIHSKIRKLVTQELKSKHVERRFCMSDTLLEKSFLNYIVTADEKWIHFHNPQQ